MKEELATELCKSLGKWAYKNSRKASRIRKTERDITKFTGEANKALRANDVSAKYVALTGLANVKIADVLADATPETQAKLKAQIQQLNAVQRSMNQTLDLNNCEAAIRGALD